MESFWDTTETLTYSLQIRKKTDFYILHENWVNGEKKKKQKKILISYQWIKANKVFPNHTPIPREGFPRQFKMAGSSICLPWKGLTGISRTGWSFGQALRVGSRITVTSLVPGTLSTARRQPTHVPLSLNMTEQLNGHDSALVKMKKIPPPLRTISWSENVSHEDLEIPGTPKTPRTSTTPGELLFVGAAEILIATTKININQSINIKSALNTNRS